MMTIPPYLRKGDKIAIISPATEIKPEYIDGAEAYLSARGYRPVVMPHARGPRHGTFAASDDDRTADFLSALTDPEIKLIFCSRGGYGCVHLMDHVTTDMIRRNPKWLLGFSDISVLHALWQKAGVASLHASMAKQLALFPDSDITEQTMRILEGTLATPENPYRIGCGKAEMVIGGKDGGEDAIRGVLTGGNLAVLNGLASTPLDILSPDHLRGKILVLEDVGEKIYQIERMLTRLHLSGALDAPEALVFGQFTDYQPDRNFPSMNDMIAYRLDRWGVATPSLLDFPAGHTDSNAPIPLGFEARITGSICHK